MTLSQYLTSRLRELGLKRGDLPRLLGYTNPNKCLRTWDRFVGGGQVSQDFLRRVQTSPLGGVEFNIHWEEHLHRVRVNQREEEFLQELKERREFVPHLHFIHERKIPSPMFVVSFIGVEHFKKLEIPDYILDVNDEESRLNLLDHFITEYLGNPPDHRLTNGPFGKVVYILFRVEYDLSWVYDVQSGEFTDQIEGVPVVGRGTLRLK